MRIRTQTRLCPRTRESTISGSISRAQNSLPGRAVLEGVRLLEIDGVPDNRSLVSASATLFPYEAACNRYDAVAQKMTIARVSRSISISEGIPCRVSFWAFCTVSRWPRPRASATSNNAVRCCELEIDRALRRLSVRGEIPGRRASSALARSDASPNLSRR